MKRHNKDVFKAHLKIMPTIPPEKEASTEVKLARIARIHLLPLMPNVAP